MSVFESKSARRDRRRKERDEEWEQQEFALRASAWEANAPLREARTELVTALGEETVDLLETWLDCRAGK